MNEEMQKMARKIEEQEEVIETLQWMCKNNAKQATDGLKAQISSHIKSAVEYYKSGDDDLNDAEKAEFYKALLEDVFSALRCVGVTV